jgi:RNase adapter protein RapZ
MRRNTHAVLGTGYEVTEAGRPQAGQQIVIMSGPAGAGRSTAIGALEDLGFEAIDNLPLSFLARLVSGSIERPVVIGIDPRNRDFSVDRLLAALGEIEAATGGAPSLVYLDCDAATLVRRYSETRRRHPLSPHGTPLAGIERERALLAPVRARADVLIDTSAMTPHELRAEMARHFGEGDRGGLAVTLQSFSYKRGLPRGSDMVIDVRFLRNPHWEAELRPLDGRDPIVRAFVELDATYAPFYARLADLVRLLLPAYLAEGKSYFGLAVGCTGGRHRSVAVVEDLAKTLAADGWRVSIRHRELERAPDDAAAVGVGTA